MYWCTTGCTTEARLALSSYFFLPTDGAIQHCGCIYIIINMAMRRRVQHSIAWHGYGIGASEHKAQEWTQGLHDGISRDPEILRSWDSEIHVQRGKEGGKRGSGMNCTQARAHDYLSVCPSVCRGLSCCWSVFWKRMRGRRRGRASQCLSVSVSPCLIEYWYGVYSVICSRGWRSEQQR